MTDNPPPDEQTEALWAEIDPCRWARYFDGPSGRSSEWTPAASLEAHIGRSWDDFHTDALVADYQNRILAALPDGVRFDDYRLIGPPGWRAAVDARAAVAAIDIWDLAEDYYKPETEFEYTPEQLRAIAPHQYTAFKHAGRPCLFVHIGDHLVAQVADGDAFAAYVAEHTGVAVTVEATEIRQERRIRWNADAA